MSELSIVVRLKARIGKQDKLRLDLSVLVEQACSEDGFIRYDLFEGQDEPGRFVVVEERSSPAAPTRHHPNQTQSGNGRPSTD